MRNHITKYILIATICLSYSCSDEFITLKSISENSTLGFYTTAKDFDNAVIASYDALQSDDLYGQAFDRLLGLRGDDAVDNNASASSRGDDIDKFTDAASNAFVSKAWRGTYIGVSRCNIVISRIDAISMDSTIKNKLKAEAQFIRALLYFNAIRIWGDVPLITEELSVQQTNQLIQDRLLVRNGIQEIYDVIEKDLLFAKQNLPNSNTGGRATSNSASALLGKVYLTQKKWTEASQVLSETTGELLPNFADVFSLTNKNNAEIIFAVAYNKEIIGEGHDAWFSNANFVIVPQTLLSEYDAVDTRLPLVQTRAGSTGLIPGKFFDTDFEKKVGNDFPVLRYSDVLLMRAEALNEINFVANGKALELLNMVRTRANMPVYTSTSLTNQEDFRNAVLKERKLELALEFDRWFDLIRTGTAITEMAKVGLTINENDLLFPIPQSEIEIINNPSGFPQNPGY